MKTPTRVDYVELSVSSGPKTKSFYQAAFGWTKLHAGARMIARAEAAAFDEDFATGQSGGGLYAFDFWRDGHWRRRATSSLLRVHSSELAPNPNGFRKK